MKFKITGLCVALSLLGGAAQAQMLRLTQPADLNKDGVVTDAERAEHEASRSTPASWDEPSPYDVKAPRGVGPAVTIGQSPADVVAQPRLEDRAVQASGFEEYINAEAEAKRRN